MGGFGSGKTSKEGRRPRTKRFVDELYSIDSFKMMNKGILDAQGHSTCKFGRFCAAATPDDLTLYYWRRGVYQKEEKQFSMLLSSPMQTVKSGFGGIRYYFTCPECGDRAKRLYFDGSDLACRKCHNLVYRTQNMSHKRRWVQRMVKEAKRDGYSYEDLSDCNKPIGKHHKKFKHAVNQFNIMQHLSIVLETERFRYGELIQKTKEFVDEGDRGVGRSDFWAMIEGEMFFEEIILKW